MLTNDGMVLSIAINMIEVLLFLIKEMETFP